MTRPAVKAVQWLCVLALLVINEYGTRFLPESAERILCLAVIGIIAGIGFVCVAFERVGLRQTLKLTAVDAERRSLGKKLRWNLFWLLFLAFSGVVFFIRVSNWFR